MAKKIAVFDFDWSLVNENSDTYVFKVLQPHLLTDINELSNTVQWTKLMSQMVGHMMKDYNISRQDLAECLRGIPYFADTFESLKFAKESGALVIILSDANEFYISEILAEFDLAKYVDKIITNFSTFEILSEKSEQHQEILKILPYQDSLNPHSCSLCPVNLCKGLCLQRLIEEIGGRSAVEKLIYVGDGGGDFCPCTTLTSKDVVCCRRDWALHNKIKTMSPPLLAECSPWSDGTEVLSRFKTFFLN